MSRKKVVTLISVFLIVCAVVIQAISMAVEGDWNNTIQIIGFVILVLGASGSIISIFIPSSYVCYISQDDWIQKEKSWFYILPAKKHGMGKHPTSIVAALDETDGSYSPTWGQAKCNSNGDIVLDWEMESINKKLRITVK